MRPLCWVRVGRYNVRGQAMGVQLYVNEILQPRHDCCGVLEVVDGSIEDFRRGPWVHIESV